MSHIFISYSSKDRPIALRLAESLRNAGREVWLDRWRITGREPYWDEIQEGIETCSHFLFLISPTSIDTYSGARKELYHAGGLKKPPIIIPAMVKFTPFDKLPILISPGTYQIHDFATQPFDKALEQVQTAIEHSSEAGEADDPVMARVAAALNELTEEDSAPDMTTGERRVDDVLSALSEGSKASRPSRPSEPRKATDLKKRTDLHVSSSSSKAGQSS